MRRIAPSVVVVLLCSAWLFLPPQARITIRLVDETGAPLAVVPVQAERYTHTIPGAEFGQDQWDATTQLTDTNGMITFTMRTALNRLAYMVYHVPAGFYADNGGSFRFNNEPVSGRWEPWNPTVDLVLKRIRDPVPMHVRHFGSGRGGQWMPATNEAVGFDLVASDWLPPHGKGEVADFVFRLDAEEIPVPPGFYDRPPYGYTLHRSKLTLTFSNPGDGIQRYLVKLRTGSELRSPTTAPEDGYEPQLVRIDNLIALRNIQRDERREDENFIFRVRSEMKDGKVVRACYGKIYGPLGWNWQGSMKFLYYLNPDPTSRSLEFDTKRNLYTPQEGETYSPGP